MNQGHPENLKKSREIYILTLNFKIMKKVIKLLPIAAIVLGTMLAMATTQKTNPANVYWDPVESSWEDLSEYPPGTYHCPDSGVCTAYMDPITGDISDRTDGKFTPL